MDSERKPNILARLKLFFQTVRDEIKVGQYKRILEEGRPIIDSATQTVAAINEMNEIKDVYIHRGLGEGQITLDENGIVQDRDGWLKDHLNTDPRFQELRQIAFGPRNKST